MLSGCEHPYTQTALDWEIQRNGKFKPETLPVCAENAKFARKLSEITAKNGNDYGKNRVYSRAARGAAHIRRHTHR